MVEETYWWWRAEELNSTMSKAGNRQGTMGGSPEGARRHGPERSRGTMGGRGEGDRMGKRRAENDPFLWRWGNRQGEALVCRMRWWPRTEPW